MGQTKVITEGAVLLALFSVFLFMSLYIIGIGTITVFLLPLPFMIFTIRHGYQKAFILFIGALLLSIVIGSVFTLLSALLFASTGIVIGELYRRKKGHYQVLLAGSITFLIGSVVLYAVSILFFKIDIIHDSLNEAKRSIDMAVKILSGLGQQPDDKMIHDIENMIDLVQYLIPSSFIFGSFIFTIITLLISRPVLKRLKLNHEPWPPFRSFKLPKSIIWYYLLLLVLMFFHFEQGSFAYSAVLNFFYIFQTLLIIQGFSLLYFYCYQKGFKKAVPVFLTILSLVIPILLYIIRILGIIDLGFDIRKRLTNDT